MNARINSDGILEVRRKEEYVEQHCYREKIKCGDECPALYQKECVGGSRIVLKCLNVEYEDAG